MEIQIVLLLLALSVTVNIWLINQVLNYTKALQASRKIISELINWLIALYAVNGMDTMSQEELEAMANLKSIKEEMEK